jgi:hypothetical protein
MIRITKKSIKMKKKNFKPETEEQSITAQNEVQPKG